jgi:hypothetical protein
MRIFIEIEVRMMPHNASKYRNGIVVHREKREGGNDLYRGFNSEIYREMARLYGATCKCFITYIIEDDDIVI